MKILIEESVLRQALDAFEHFAGMRHSFVSTKIAEGNITALSTALDAAEKVEPVCEHQYIGAGLQPKFWRCLKCGEVKDAAPAVLEVGADKTGEV